MADVKTLALRKHRGRSLANALQQPLRCSSPAKYCTTCQREVLNAHLLERAHVFWYGRGTVQSEENVPSVQYKLTWATLCRNAESGCKWCSYLHTGVAKKNSLSRHRELFVTIRVRPARKPRLSPEGLNVLEVKVQCSRLAPRATEIALQPNSTPVKRAIAAREALFYRKSLALTSKESSSATSKITADRVRDTCLSRVIASETQRWLNECQQHQDCGPMHQKEMPTRVIDVSHLGRPRLTDTAGRSGQFVALSYCWGFQQTGILTKAALQDFYVFIDPEKLSATLSEAISVVHCIGIRYLWIDALCIIQDCNNDKAREIARMSRIYQNALLTLVVANSKSAAAGFISHREGPEPILVLPMRSDTQEYTDVEVFEIMGRPPRNEPLDERGWTFQEWVLSSRRLIFGSDTLKWHCPQLSENACKTLRLEDDWHFIHEYLTPPKWDDIEDVIFYWARMVREYSRRQLQNENDKLNAIAGIAQEIFAKTKCEYMAGHFRCLLVEQLLWDVEGDASRPTKYRAPSWSWASVDGLINFWFFTHGHFQRSGKPTPIACELVRYAVEPVFSQNPFGEVASGVVWLRARCMLLFGAGRSTKDMEIKPDLPSLHDKESLPEGSIAMPILLLNDHFWGLLLSPSSPARWRRIGIVIGPRELLSAIPFRVVEVE